MPDSKGVSGLSFCLSLVIGRLHNSLRSPLDIKPEGKNCEFGFGKGFSYTYGLGPGCKYTNVVARPTGWPTGEIQADFEYTTGLCAWICHSGSISMPFIKLPELTSGFALNFHYDAYTSPHIVSWLDDDSPSARIMRAYLIGDHPRISPDTVIDLIIPVPDLVVAASDSSREVVINRST